MFSFKYVKNIKYFLLLLALISTSKTYLVFPVNTLLANNFSQVNNSLNFSSEDLLNYYLPNDMYTYIYIGSSPNKIYTFLDHEEYGSFIDNSICKFPSVYNNYSSSSFFSISNYIISYSDFSNMCFAKETFYAYTDFNLDKNKMIKMENLTILYSPIPKNDSLYFKLNKDHYITGYSCFHLGLQIPVSGNYYESFIRQFKNSDYIETTYWTIEFKNKNLINSETYLIIGVPPHIYNPDKYKKKYFRSIVSQLRVKNYNDYRVNIWGIIFDKIYFISNNETLNNNEIILQSIKCKIDLSINLIEGSSNYLENIENDFFNNLYDNNICFKEKRKSERNGIYFVIWCDKKYYNEIKKFPSLYFKSNDLEYIFELNYEDLFMIHGEKIFFLMLFRTTNGMFTFGKLFFKKYLFTFSFDNRIIGFYNDKLDFNSQKMNDLTNKSNYGLKEKIILCIFSVVFIFVLLVLFIKIKKRYLSDRQKRMNELIDNNYIYMSNQVKNDIFLNDKSKVIIET